MFINMSFSFITQTYLKYLLSHWNFQHKEYNWIIVFYRCRRQVQRLILTFVFLCQDQSDELKNSAHITVIIKVTK